MAHLVARGIEHAWGSRIVLQGIDLTVADGERIGLIGVNGSGKSTLLSILAGHVHPDHGEVVANVRVAGLEQEPDLPGETVADTLTAATRWHGELVERYHGALAVGDHEAAGAVQDRLDLVGWTVDHRVDAMCDRLGVAARDARLERLSGGERRRLALACTLLSGADVLLLDEPTNHLDADTVAWLEAFLTGYRGAVVMVTHDRYLLEAVANRIVEIEHGEAVVYDDCSYGDYLIARAERQARLEQAEGRRLELMAREAVWASRSPAARTTKQKARLDRLEALRAQPKLQRSKSLEFTFESGDRGGSTAFELHGARKGYGGRTLFADLDLTVTPGERIGLLGPNGARKTTLLRVIRGTETLDGGQLVLGRRVKLGVLDQERSGLVETDTLLEAVAGKNDRVVVGDRTVHVITYLERFLFDREQHGQRVSGLSGGERARLLLAKLLLQGANLLLLDEPTNDLDLVTLRVLEEALLGYDGTVVVVTHDRAFLDRVCTGVVGFDGRGGVRRYADRLQYVRAIEPEPAPTPEVRTVAPPPPKREPTGSRKRSWKEARELESLPQEIERVEAEIEAMDARLADPATYQDGTDVRALTAEREASASALEALYERWETLDALEA